MSIRRNLFGVPSMFRFVVCGLVLPSLAVLGAVNRVALAPRHLSEKREMENRAQKMEV